MEQRWEFEVNKPETHTVCQQIRHNIVNENIVWSSRSDCALTAYLLFELPEAN